MPICPFLVALSLLFGPAASLAAESLPLDAHRTLGTAKTFRNLTLIPVYDGGARPLGAYLTLDEGLTSKLVTVKESPDGGDVNTLYVSNAAHKPLYVMAGEVVLGGQQDRCLGEDTLIPPGSQHVPVPVFCVEHGRWTGQAAFASTAGMAAGSSIRASAEDGAFAVGGTTYAMSPAHVAVPAAAPVPVENAQQQVWDKVAAKNARFGATPASGTYREVLNLSAGGAQTTVTPYLKALAGSLGHDPHLVGVVAGVNGRVVTADVFNDPLLFRRLWPKLLRSYAADAAENVPARSTRPITPAQARLFWAKASDARQETQNRTALTTTLRRETGETLDYRLVPRGEEGARAVHENALRK